MPSRSRARDRTAERAPYRKAEDVRALILDATITLLSGRLPSQITVRDIARKAGVQHSLITRHFGSKDRLIVEAVEQVARAYADVVTSAERASDGYVAALRHFQDAPVSALALIGPLSGRGTNDRERRFPGYAAHLRQLIDAGAPDDLDTSVFAGMMMGLVGSWPLMERAFMGATGLGADQRDEMHAATERIMADLVASQVKRRPRPTRRGR